MQVLNKQQKYQESQVQSDLDLTDITKNKKKIFR